MNKNEKWKTLAMDDVVRWLLNAPDLEDARKITSVADCLQVRRERLRYLVRGKIEVGSIVAFDTNRARDQRRIVGKVREIRAKNVIVLDPRTGNPWRVPLHVLKFATDEEVEKYEGVVKMYGEATYTPRPRRKSKDRLLLESIMGMAR